MTTWRLLRKIDKHLPAHFLLPTLIVFALALTFVKSSTADPQSPNTNDPLSLVREGYTLYDQGHLEDALEKFERALQLDPDLPEGHYALASALEWMAWNEDPKSEKKAGLLQKAEDRYLKVIKLGQGDAETYRRLFRIHLQKHQWVKSVTVFAKYFWLSAHPISHALIGIIVLALLLATRKARVWPPGKTSFLFLLIIILTGILLWFQITLGKLSKVDFLWGMFLITISAVVVAGCSVDIIRKKYRHK